MGGGGAGTAPPCAGAASSRWPQMAHGSPPWYCGAEGGRRGQGGVRHGLASAAHSRWRQPMAAVVQRGSAAASCSARDARHGSARRRRTAPPARASASCCSRPCWLGLGKQRLAPARRRRRRWPLPPPLGGAAWTAAGARGGTDRAGPANKGAGGPGDAGFCRWLGERALLCTQLGGRDRRWLWRNVGVAAGRRPPRLLMQSDNMK